MTPAERLSDGLKAVLGEIVFSDFDMDGLATNTSVKDARNTIIRHVTNGRTEVGALASIAMAGASSAKKAHKNTVSLLNGLGVEESKSD
jgi:hypothetical protein